MSRIVLVHDWLTGMRGGEKCLEAACRQWPDAPLFTLLHRRGSVSSTIERHSPHVSPIGRLPGISHYYRYLLPILPAAARWRIPDCDAVLSFSHCVAKSAIPPAGVPHVCYCFTPMRYAWQLRDAYFPGWKGRLISPLLKRLREWDRRTSSSVSHFIAISRTIQQRIHDCYGRESEVIYPPVDVQFYTPDSVERENYYLAISAFVPYKRFDLAIQACTRLKRRLIVIGRGPQESQLKAMAGPTVEFLGWQPDEVIRDHYRRAKALLFPAEEDFGIVPLEAQACGCPVIAYGQGGAVETVRPLGSDNPTGILFENQTVESLIGAMERLEANRDAFDPTAARRNALPFRLDRYERELLDFMQKVMGKQPSLAHAA